jgi:hypothetical protein
MNFKNIGKSKIMENKPIFLEGFIPNIIPAFLAFGAKEITI